MEKYSDGLLDEKFSNVEDKMDDHFNAITTILGDIKVQTTTTNGRVSKLENWQNRLIGAWMVVSLVCLPVLGLLGWTVIEQGKTIERLETALDL